ncbi:hypothetical protein A2303_05715 [Candidatus Falkowbacteria bacterium RIFOXYB2_FULL_47_14]|uniref:DUF5667 domain-containing protein n=1 Tax=Candidatus Falkowbacteria bacterium RIFOXYA2_FULL_47_19 TaxID=1797994 RepID=A0A1F5SFN1_9BACT|nr:MAG: hypothetical protein A2227_07115 [Candidatus Falkowbacteria bacterium RIFOXYA2_FULL_47_19]OGF35341.1 MAG: hypothetical protein A2468_00265 [Candidatus Falkowbacteria bacterium RIFOXYC2_FULL_46_15]OGF43783.1 MAG: hypothetical protein A2303_05715 [Candidatus Falkowbacteria bacterium RIFOXYB2_FULL_47_14]
MKHFKTITSIMVLSLMLVPFLSFAQGNQSGQKGVQEAGTGIENPELEEAGQGIGQGLEAQNATSLQNQGEEQQNQVELQQNAQAGKKSINGNGKGGQLNDRAAQRRSRVANAVEQMLQVAERNHGVGQQIRTIAQNQDQNQKEIETTLEHAKNNRGNAVWRFFFGPNKYIYMAENKLAAHAEKLEELKELASQITNEADAEILDEQIEIMEQAKTELAGEIKEEGRGFGLFGWLNKLLSK